MGSPTLKTFNLLCRTDKPGKEIADERLVRLAKSGVWDKVVDHPDYDGLAAELSGKRGEPVIRRARALDLETCGPKLDLPFGGARIHTDVYGEGDGSFDLTKVEPLPLDTSLQLGPALEAVMPRRAKLSQGARRKRWFVKNANAGTLPLEMQRLAEEWKKRGRVIFFADSSWLSDNDIEYVEYAYVNVGRWFDNFDWAGLDFDERYCVLVSK